MTRLPLPTRESLPEALQGRWDRASARGPILNVQRMFMTNPEIEGRNLAWEHCGLAPRQRELVILRAAYRQQSRYEWHQHVRIARAAGLTDVEIDATRNWETATCFSPAERSLLAWVDALADPGQPTDEAYVAFSAGREPAEIFGVTYLATRYFALARIMSAFDLQTEEPFVGWAVGGE